MTNGRDILHYNDSELPSSGHDVCGEVSQTCRTTARARRVANFVISSATTICAQNIALKERSSSLECLAATLVFPEPGLRFYVGSGGVP